MSALAERLRDPTRLAHNDADLLRALSLAQQSVNAAEEAVFDTTDFTTVPNVSIYPVLGYLPKAIKIVSVRQQERDLMPVSLGQLREADIQWLRRKGGRFEEYAVIGRGMLAFYPLVNVGVTLSVRYLKHTDNLTAPTSVVELGDEYVPTVLGFAELLLSLRQRKFQQVQPLAEAMARFMGGDGGAEG